MKKFFEEPIIDVVKFAIVDVITTSGSPGLDENEGDIDIGA